MDSTEIIDNLKKINGIVAISQFGSYGTDYLVKDRSDIYLSRNRCSSVKLRNRYTHDYYKRELSEKQKF